MVALEGSRVDELRRFVRRHGDVPAPGIESIDLGAAMELACARAEGEGAMRTAVDAWAEAHPFLADALAGLAGHVPVVEIYSAPIHEVRAAPRSADELAGDLWVEHRDRFGRSLRQHLRLATALAAAISAAYGEMVDNVVSHAALEPDCAECSVAGFTVSQEGFAFAVADVGRGVLASLHEKKEHRGLQDHRAALDAAIRRGATRRAAQYGNGFSDLHRALADLQGTLRFRSGDAVLTLDGRGQNRNVVEGSSPALPGFQLSVTCAPFARPLDSRPVSP